MIDFHSHILPKMDDGSRSSDQSVEMLHESRRQGVELVALTSHFYAYENSPEQFLLRREASWNRLKERLDEQMPRILLGAEVQYFEGITIAEGIEDLRITGTDVLLLEMPFSPWSRHMIEDVLELNSRKHMQVMLAHIERYMRWQKRAELWQELRAHHVLLQCNPEFFLNWQTSRKAAAMVKGGLIDALGSDAHNMSERRPRLGEAAEVIRSKCGKDALQRIEMRSGMLVDLT